jgi:hypothetical protein
MVSSEPIRLCVSDPVIDDSQGAHIFVDSPTCEHHIEAVCFAKLAK